MNQQDTKDLTVNILQISIEPGDGKERMNLSSSGIAAFVDSTVSSIFLPLGVCERFEDAFGIEWNEAVQGYPVNDTLHKLLKTRSALVTFTISNSSSSNTHSSSVDIKLPYAAFDLLAEPPLMKNRTRYFPLMRAANESQYTLGRTFLQEAYLIADYERHHFSISQCAWNGNAQQDIVAIRSLTAGHKHHLSPGSLAGVVVGCFIVVIVLVLGLWLYSKRILPSKEDSNTGDEHRNLAATTQLQNDGVAVEIDGAHPHGNEIDGRAARRPELGDVHPVGQELNGYVDREMEGSNVWPPRSSTKDTGVSELPA
ncbi:MAG: hypothetical protein Q9218_006621 [Villophora microphyllina]